MAILRFQGIVTAGDLVPVLDERSPGRTRVDGHNVLAQVDDADFSGPVTVAVTTEYFTEFTRIADYGSGHGEADVYGDEEGEEETVDALPLADVLARHIGHDVILWIADEPLDPDLVC